MPIPRSHAKRAFARPILHGLCTFGMATHAVLKAFCNYESERIKAMSVRFTAPLYPGETVRFQLWRRDDRVHLRGRVEARDAVVLNNGFIELA